MLGKITRFKDVSSDEVFIQEEEFNSFYLYASEEDFEADVPCAIRAEDGDIVYLDPKVTIPSWLPDSWNEVKTTGKSRQQRLNMVPKKYLGFAKYRPDQSKYRPDQWEIAYGYMGSRTGGIFCTTVHEPTPVVTLEGACGKLELWAAEIREADAFDGPRVQLTKSNSAAYAGYDFKHIFTAGFEPLKEYLWLPKTTLVVQLDWPDGDMPPVRFTFWYALYEHMRFNGHNTMQFNCLGGHGRTGTALVAMMMAVNGSKWKSALKLVRDTFCHKCVETQAQIDYLVEMEAWLQRNNNYK